MVSGKEVKAIRLQCLMSQVEFADQLGVAFSTVNRWENDRCSPNYQALRKIQHLCKQYDIPFTLSTVTDEDN